MKQNELEIQNNMRVNFGLRNRKVYRSNRPVLCKECVTANNYPVKTKKEQFDTAEKGVQFEYKDNKIICPNCGRELEIVKTYDDWKIEQDKVRSEAKRNVHLVFYDKSWSSGVEYYHLSTRLDTEDWNKVAKYFFYVRYSPDDDEQDTMMGKRLHGWYTRNPREVEKTLGIREELTIDYRKRMKKERERELRMRLERRSQLKQEIVEHFTDQGERPLRSIRDIKGETLEPKEYPWNIYGGGYLFIISEDGLWFIRNNGADGDDWSRNNIETGGAGAIGWTVPYDGVLVDMIREYCSL